MIKYVVNSDVKKMENFSVQELMEYANNNPSGPLPFFKVEGKDTKNLGVDESAVIHYADQPAAIIAVGLSSCAAVILARYDGGVPKKAALYHANGGTIKKDNLVDLMVLLDLVCGEPLPESVSILAIYAVPKKEDKYYIEDANKISWCGVSSENILLVSNADQGNFGINNRFLVGGL
ncbi:hypothetical protein [Pseudomonas sp. MF4836]|uniref:hypothetical protein n=1 Tax=Pseudomonas sp. MF4836 TaxID=1960827 RepID=UPI0012906096|nr:hypothetical protein [Pseudomonas sp. MF4836]